MRRRPAIDAIARKTFDGRDGTARNVVAFDDENGASGAGEVSGRDEAVVTRANDNGVVPGLVAGAGQAAHRAAAGGGVRGVPTIGSGAASSGSRRPRKAKGRGSPVKVKCRSTSSKPILR